MVENGRLNDCTHPIEILKQINKNQEQDADCKEWAEGKEFD